MLTAYAALQAILKHELVDASDVISEVHTASVTADDLFKWNVKAVFRNQPIIVLVKCIFCTQ